jgi:outer membrane protein OmpA-like peptidoglycan-associated protein
MVKAEPGLRSGLSTRDVGGALQRKCACGQHSSAECQECKKKHSTLQRQASGITPQSTAPPVVHEVLRSPGQPLEKSRRTQMETRLARRAVSSLPANVNSSPGALRIGPADSPAEREADIMADNALTGSGPPGLAARQDFSRVRVHTDNRAAEAARAVHADAFTVGQDIVFGAGRYDLDTIPGRRLLAHELTHTLQQRSASQIQRTLSVDPKPPKDAPATDPARSLPDSTKRSMVDSQIRALCPLFKVNTAGEVVPNSPPLPARSQLAAGTKSTGCCCLSILTSSSNAFTISVSGMLGAQTIGRNTILNPTNTPIESGVFTASNTLTFQGAIPTIGHELCGHAALDEIKVEPIEQKTPPDTDRLRTDLHDPTVRIENEISKEQGVPASGLRGLARSGSHRGESSDRITIMNFPFNVMEIPASENGKLDVAAKYIFNKPAQQDEYVGIRGHSDNVGTDEAKQSVSAGRAQNVKQALRARGVPDMITAFNLPSVARFNPVEGVSDKQPPPAPLDSDAANWRRVEILISNFPAGAQKIPPGTPTAVGPHKQSPLLASQKASIDPCISKLANEAYP